MKKSRRNNHPAPGELSLPESILCLVERIVATALSRLRYVRVTRATRRQLQSVDDRTLNQMGIARTELPLLSRGLARASSRVHRQ